jgi:hypothetical protein
LQWLADADEYGTFIGGKHKGDTGMFIPWKAHRMIRSAEEFIALRTSECPDEYGRSAHDEAPIEVWREVILLHPEMRRWVIHNKTVPIEILSILACDADPRVRSAVATKRKLTAELFAKLSDDEDASVRLRVAINAKVPSHLLHKLTRDDSPFVREEAQTRWGARDLPAGPGSIPLR